ncbi:GL14615 [Drosophila persimilis]|uniref:GL14615 n=1 Tax=Drosophila persimilis TaxID=7234 RepID=B4GVR9_DROPE|nr:GL14615 [Drosophila persimilis]
MPTQNPEPSDQTQTQTQTQTPKAIPVPGPSSSSGQQVDDSYSDEDLVRHLGSTAAGDSDSNRVHDFECSDLGFGSGDSWAC